MRLNTQYFADPACQHDHNPVFSPLFFGLWSLENTIFKWLNSLIPWAFPSYMEFHVNISIFQTMKIESDSFEVRLRHGVSFRRVHPDRFGRSHGRGATCVWTGCYCVFFSTWPPLPQQSPVSFFLAAWWNRVRGAYVDQSNPQFSLTYLMTRHHQPFFFFSFLKTVPRSSFGTPPAQWWIFIG